MTVYIAGPDGKPLAFANEVEAEAYRRAQREAEPPLLQCLRKHHSEVARLERQAREALEQRRGRSAALTTIMVRLSNLCWLMGDDIKAAESEAIIRALPPCGMIFEFKEMDRAKAFAAAVEGRFGLGSRVFDDADEAAKSHAFPFVQNPPVVHVDRPYWKTGIPSDETIGIERQIEELAKEFSGKFVGT